MRNCVLFYLHFYFKNYSQVIYIYGFYVGVILLFTLADNVASASNPALLMQASWGGALLALLLSAPLFFGAEEDNGAIHSMRLWPISAEVIVLSKLISYFLAIILPFTLAVLCTLWLLMPEIEGRLLSAGLLFASGLLSCAALTMMASVMSVGSGKRSMLVSIIIMPWLLPIIMMGASASLAAPSEHHVGVTLVPALALIICPLAVIVSAAMLRLQR